MENKVRKRILEKGRQVLSIYFTAGFPELNQSGQILQSLEKAGVDFVEVGMPFSDPLADGPVIQKTSARALVNGMNMQLLFDQVRASKTEQMPKIWMGYVNQLMRFGLSPFIAECVAAGIDTLIVPDLPIEVYEKEFKNLFDEAGISLVFLISPQTKEDRIWKIDSLSQSFIYMVADASVTGAKKGISQKQIEYFERIKNMGLKNPCIIGFGISDKETFDTASQYASGAIIGSAFLKHISNSENLANDIPSFIQSIRK